MAKNFWKFEHGNQPLKLKILKAFARDIANSSWEKIILWAYLGLVGVRYKTPRYKCFSWSSKSRWRREGSNNRDKNQLL